MRGRRRRPPRGFGIQSPGSSSVSHLCTGVIPIARGPSTSAFQLSPTNSVSPAVAPDLGEGWPRRSGGGACGRPPRPRGPGRRRAAARRSRPGGGRGPSPSWEHTARGSGPDPAARPGTSERLVVGDHGELAAAGVELPSRWTRRRPRGSRGRGAAPASGPSPTPPYASPGGGVLVGSARPRRWPTRCCRRWPGTRSPRLEDLGQPPGLPVGLGEGCRRSRRGRW